MNLAWVSDYNHAQTVVETSTDFVPLLFAVWAGDPPHESPGWYDLYDTDEAMNIVHEQQQTIAKWISENGKNSTGY